MWCFDRWITFLCTIDSPRLQYRKSGVLAGKTAVFCGNYAELNLTTQARWGPSKTGFVLYFFCTLGPQALHSGPTAPLQRTVIAIVGKVLGPRLRAVTPTTESGILSVA